MSIKEAVKYHKKMLDNKNIILYEEKGVLLGYLEVWKITPKQLERIILRKSFSGYLRNVNDGKIAYVANLWIRKDMRQSHVIRMLKLMYFNHIKGCSHCIWRDVNRNSRLRVFKNKRSE